MVFSALGSYPWVLVGNQEDWEELYYSIHFQGLCDQQWQHLIHFLSNKPRLLIVALHSQKGHFPYNKNIPHILIGFAK